MVNSRRNRYQYYIMKKLSSLLVLFLATAVCYGQNSREIKAVSGSTYVEKQEAYTPSFKHDGSRRTVRNIILRYQLGGAIYDQV